jgi:hypothetical protein
MVDIASSLTNLQEKIQLLLKRTALMEKENLQLKASLTKEQNHVKELMDEVQQGKSKIAAAMVNTASMQPSDKEALIKKVDHYIKEIDTAIKNYQADINAYKIETASKIAANELSIKNFNSKIENEKKELRASYLSKIEMLEKKNRDLKNKLDNYQDDGNDKWRTFKAEFGKEMDDLGKSIKDLASKDNK